MVESRQKTSLSLWKTLNSLIKRDIIFFPCKRQSDYQTNKTDASFKKLNKAVISPAFVPMFPLFHFFAILNEKKTLYFLQFFRRRISF